MSLSPLNKGANVWFSIVSWFTVGAEADDDMIELLLSQVKGKDITELIAAGREKLASVPSAGGAAVAVAASGGGGGAAPAAAESKKEEKVEEKEESEEEVSLSWPHLVGNSTLIFHYSYFENCPNHSHIVKLSGLFNLVHFLSCTVEPSSLF